MFGSHVPGLLMVGTLLIVGCTDNQDRIGENKAQRASATTGAVAPEQNQSPTKPAGKQPPKGHGLAADVENDTARMPTGTRPSQANDTTGKRISAEAEFVGAPGTKLHGDAELKEIAGGVRIELDIEDAPPGRKSVAIYGAGDCSTILQKTGQQSATVDDLARLPNAATHRTKPLASVTVDDDGDGELTIVVPAVHLEGHDGRSLAQRAIVLQEGSDTGGSSNIGAKPVGCAVIRPS